MTIQLNQIGTFQTDIFDDGATEIPAFDALTDRLFVTNGSTNSVDVIDLSVPTTPALLFSIDIAQFGAGLTSVAVSNGILAVAVVTDPETDPGSVVFFSTDLASGDSPLGTAGVGALPERYFQGFQFCGHKGWYHDNWSELFR